MCATHRSFELTFSDRSLLGFVDGVCSALSQIARDLDGARAVIEAEALGTVIKLLKLRKARVRNGVPDYSVSSQSINRPGGRSLLLSRVHHWSLSWDVVSSAFFALWQIANELDGAKAVAKAGALNLVPELIESPAADVRTYMCLLLIRLARYNRVPPSA
ncbi:hypothetical protein B0H16DRAFT_1730843 [Mycena metata]|uniref:Uncharacterized protein n=1 Tax=Mycena metata TaxID=1033252 RepID=A0AAD7I6N2_9AGAR|nr:hypothetical protein B0H16DRAFT_1730843 [Mycena metata]